MRDSDRFVYYCERCANENKFPITTIKTKKLVACSFCLRIEKCYEAKQSELKERNNILEGLALSNEKSYNIENNLNIKEEEVRCWICGSVLVSRDIIMLGDGTRKIIINCNSCFTDLIIANSK